MEFCEAKVEQMVLFVAQDCHNLVNAWLIGGPFDSVTLDAVASARHKIVKLPNASDVDLEQIVHIVVPKLLVSPRLKGHDLRVQG